MTRNTRTYSDLDLNFIANPVTGDISKKFDENAVKQSIKNLVMTRHYERPFHPEIGSPVMNLLFEPFSPMLKVTMERAISYTIDNFEPRVALRSVDVELNEENNSVYVHIEYIIINTTQPQTVDFTLQRTR
jgi:phage baseplate assembly protein W